MRLGRLRIGMLSSRELAREQAIERRRRKALSRAQIQQGRINGKRFESPGRPYAKVAGSWMSDVASTRQCVLLCWQCAPKWDPRPYGYKWDRHFEAQGPCDSCRGMHPRIRVYIHESYLDRRQKTLHPEVR